MPACARHRYTRNVKPVLRKFFRIAMGPFLAQSSRQIALSRVGAPWVGAVRFHGLIFSHRAAVPGTTAMAAGRDRWRRRFCIP
jgi:hypothetical protein